jgi:DNA-binding response OmpR family regulator
LERARILVIEDDPDVRDTVCGALESIFEGARVTALADGREFLEVFESIQEWDLVVCDLMLPDLSGVEICKRIRASVDGAKSVPILAMTGYDTPEMEKKVRNAGATAYMAKPFEMHDFKRIVKELLGR